MANLYTLPPECDFKKDVNGARAFMGIFLRYSKGKTFYERPFVSNLKTISKMLILPPPGKFLRTPIQLTDVQNDPVFFQALFPKTTWTCFGNLLTNCTQSMSKPTKQSCNCHLYGSVNMDFLEPRFNLICFPK